MTDANKARETLGKLLRLTRDDEIDCDEFGRHVAALVEGTVDPKLQELLEHHLEICPECEEERQILARALGLPPDPS